MSSRILAAALTILLTSAAISRAQTYVSSGTGGEFLASAQVISSPTPQSLADITGSLALVNGTSSGNIFEIYINNPSQFMASTASLAGGANDFDSQLFLFNSSGIGIEADDDDPSTGNQQAVLPGNSSYLSNQVAGDYYLLIEGSGRYPTDASGNLIFPNFTDGVTNADSLVGPTGPGGASPFAGFTGSSGEGGTYSIELAGAQFIAVPEPSALPLIALGGLFVCFNRARRAVI